MGQFRINNAGIIPRKLALLPLAMYLYDMHNRRHRLRHMTDDVLLSLKPYLILSQACDWNLQTIVVRFSAIVRKTWKDSANV
jgi:hypothetical protein